MENNGHIHFWRPDKTLICNELNDYFSSGFLTDLKVMCGKRVFNVHKLVLAAASPYFLDMFNQDQEIDQINLSEYCEKDVEAFFNDLYEMPNVPDSKQDYCSILDLFKIEHKESNQIEFDYYLSNSVKQEINDHFSEYEHNLEDPSLKKLKNKPKKQKIKSTSVVKDPDSTKIYRDKSTRERN